MIEKYLKSDHWEIFLLTFGLLLLLIFVNESFYIPKIDQNNTSEILQARIDSYLYIFIIYYISIISWAINISFGLNNKLKIKKLNNKILFLISIFFPIIHLLGFLIASKNINGNSSNITIMIIFILISSLITTIAIFYWTLKTSEIIKTLDEETNNKLKINKLYLALLIIIFPIGIWLVQKNITENYNKLLENNSKI
ncbi:MAG: hypothetical protein MJ211_03640 [Bacteroidales bacterium]|nr:hypothetical protein [Bacteroidales bacterium]